MQYFKTVGQAGEAPTRVLVHVHPIYEIILSFGIYTVLEERYFSIAHTEVRKEETGPLI